MDGIAIDVREFTGKGQEFIIEGMQAAGAPQLTLLNIKNCVEVMTGSMLPENTNSVIRYEDLDVRNGTAKVLIDQIGQGMNIHSRASDAARGDALLTPGQKISAAEVAVLASVGKSRVKVYTLPKVAVISSGDELVEIETEPKPHQIRRSNTYALQAAMQEMNWRSEAFHVHDDRSDMKHALEKILSTHDVLVLSGGVSKGKFDFIPSVLEELGVKKLFHQVSQRPGKPFWFGVSDRNVVFALPGNPVSTFLCFHKYIKPWLIACCGAETKSTNAVLASDVNFSPALRYFLQVRTEIAGGKIIAHPHAGGGSGDFVNLKEVDGFIELPMEKSTFKAGESYTFISFRV
jgi:molybdopterin molybdotransferase